MALINWKFHRPYWKINKNIHDDFPYQTQYIIWERLWNECFDNLAILEEGKK